MRVVIIEDAPEMARLVSLILKADSNIETIEWTDHFDALTSSIEWSTVDVVIVDKLLGVYDGTQFLRWLKQEYPSIKRVMLTGDATVDIETSPAHTVLVKPASAEVIRTAVYAC